LVNKIENNSGDVYTILAVDDTKVNLLLLSALLEDYNVITVENGFDAIDIAQNEHIDLILLDIMMPEMDGYEVCEKMKASEKSRNIPIIFITAKTDEDSIDRAYKVGGIDYVTKPFKSKELLARVKTQISVYTLQKELEEKMALVDKYVSYSTTDTNGVIIEVSDAFCKISGYLREELIGKKHNILRHSDMNSALYSDLWTTIKNGKQWKGEVKNRRKDGGYYWANVLITPRYNAVGKLFGYTAIRHDITNEKIVEKLSITDQLTNLHNRRYFNDNFPIEIKRSIRQGSFLAFIMLDVDFFKQYNDTYGHQSGDKVLSTIGKTLTKEISRAEDLTFRLGGEEFGIICNVNSYNDAKSISGSICQSIRDLNIEHQATKVLGYKLTVSLGVVCVDFSQEQNMHLTSDILYKIADDELYKSKLSGRDRLSLSIM